MYYLNTIKEINNEYKKAFEIKYLFEKSRQKFYFILILFDFKCYPSKLKNEISNIVAVSKLNAAKAVLIIRIFS